jgi:hypothetical protein
LLFIIKNLTLRKTIRSYVYVAVVSISTQVLFVKTQTTAEATSIYAQGKGEKWNTKLMFEIMLEISKTSLQVLGSDLFNQITESK